MTEQIDAVAREPRRDVTPASVRTWLAGPGFWPALLAVLVVQTVASCYLLRQSYFFAEDFTFLQLFASDDLDYDTATRVIFGHLIPGFVVVNKFLGLWFGPSWLAASIVTLVVQLGGTLAFARLVHALAGRTWWLPIATAAFGCSVVNLTTVPWWGATMTIQAALTMCVATWASAIAYARDLRLRHLATLALSYAVALAFWEKSLATCAYLGLFVLIVGVRARDDSWGARLRECLRLWPVWLILTVLSVIDLAIYLTGEYLDAAGESPTLGHTAEYFGREFVDAVSPAMLGIAPVSLSGWVASTAPWVCAGIVLGVMVWSLRRSTIARRAWLWWVVAFVISQSFVARGRLGLLTIEQLTHDLRYSLDAVMLLLVAAVVALPAAAGAASWSRRSRGGAAVAAAGLAVLALWVNSVLAIGEATPGHLSRTYFAALRTQQVPADVRLLDIAVPGSVIPPPQAPWNRMSRIAPLLQPGVTITDDPTDASMIRIDGSIAPFSLIPRPGAASHPGCTTKREPLTVLTASQPPDSFHPPVVTFSYDSARRGSLALEAVTPSGTTGLRGTGKPLRIGAGTGALASVVVPVDWTAITVRSLSGERVCIDDIQYGEPDFGDH